MFTITTNVLLILHHCIKGITTIFCTIYRAIYILTYIILLYYVYDNISCTGTTNTGSSATVIGGKDCPPLNDFGLGIISTNFVW